MDRYYCVEKHLENLKKDRDVVFRALRAENIGVNVHYIPVPWLTYYKKFGYKKSSWPISESTFYRLISLPMWPGMTDDDI